MEVDVSKILELYNCNECPKHFSSDFLLKSHVGLMHTPIKEFECSLCLYADDQKLTFEKHLETCHKDRPNNEANMSVV